MSKISALTELAEAPASTDEFVIVDKSDTTMATTGTTKRIQSQYVTIADASTTVKGKVELATDAEAITGTDTVRAVTPSNLTAKMDTDGTLAGNSDTRIPSQKAVKTYVDAQGGDTAPANLLKNGNFINNSTNGYGSTPDDWTSSNANPVQGGIPALTKQNLIDGLGVATGDIEGLWPCNALVNTDDIDDLSDNAYDLDSATHVPAVSSDGLMGGALDFEAGSSQYGTVGTPTNLLITGSQTFIVFIKPESFGSDLMIMGHNDSGNTVYGRLAIESSAGGAYFQLFGLTTNSIVISDVKMQTGKWYMLVGVYDSANSLLKIWINGIKKQTTASGTHTTTGTQTFSIGRSGALASNYYDGLVQNACVLSVALTDNQVKKLFAMTMYKGQKIRRETTNAYAYQQLPQNLVEQLRGKTVALRADLWQEVASTAQISIHQTMADATTDETIISATDATTGSWLSKVATGTLEADVVTVEIRIKHSTTDGNTWFRNVSLYEGSTLLPYDHSKDDWSRFPRLLKIDPPYVTSGYKFEENRWFDASTPTYSASGSLTYTSVSTQKNKFMIQGKTFFFEIASSGTTGGTASTDIIQSLEGIFMDATAYVYVGGAGLFDGADMSGYIIRDNTNNGVRFLKYNKANWGLGAARDIRGSGFYVIN